MTQPKEFSVSLPLTLLLDVGCDKMKRRQGAIIAVVGMALLLALVIVPAVVSSRARLKSENLSTTRHRMVALRNVINLYQVDHDGYPPTLGVLVTTQAFGRSYLKANQSLEDSWGTALRYTSSVDSYEVRSAGRDRTFDTEDDIFIREGTPNQ